MTARRPKPWGWNGVAGHQPGRFGNGKSPGKPYARQCESLAMRAQRTSLTSLRGSPVVSKAGATRLRLDIGGQAQPQTGTVPWDIAFFVTSVRPSFV